MAIKIGTAEIDDTGMDAKTRGAFAAIAQAFEASGAATTQQITELTKKLEGFDPKAITDLAGKIDALSKNAPTPTGDPKDKPTPPKPGDAAEQMKAMLVELLKPITDKVTAIEGERTAQQRAAAHKAAIEAYARAKQPNRDPARVAMITEDLLAEFGSAEKLDEATIDKAFGAKADRYAKAAGAKNADAWLGAKPKADPGTPDALSEEAEAKNKRIEEIRRRGSLTTPVAPLNPQHQGVTT